MWRPTWLDEFRAFIMRGNVVDLAIGIGVALLARWLFLRLGIDPHLGPRALVYPSLAILVTLVLWVTLFRV